MYKKLFVVVMIVVILMVLVPVAQAITFGQPDGDGHPNVGAMIVQEPDGVNYLYCSGTLIAPDVFLTAAHCTAAADAYGADPEDVFVTFDPVWDENATLHPGTYYLNPNYGHDMHDLNDVAVIVLGEEIENIEPATLPSAGLLSDMKKNKELKGQQFVPSDTVHYGTTRPEARTPWVIPAYATLQIRRF